MKFYDAVRMLEHWDKEFRINIGMAAEIRRKLYRMWREEGECCIALADDFPRRFASTGCLSGWEYDFYYEGDWKFETPAVFLAEIENKTRMLAELKELTNKIVFDTELSLERLGEYSSLDTALRQAFCIAKRSHTGKIYLVGSDNEDIHYPYTYWICASVDSDKKYGTLQFREIRTTISPVPITYPNTQFNRFTSEYKLPEECSRFQSVLRWILCDEARATRMFDEQEDY